MEFLVARRKGIPIYAFVERGITTILPVWEKNKDSDFTGTVDTPLLFEFVKNVMTQEKVWTFPFDTAQDIINVLRIQFAYLFHDALSVRMRLAGKQLPPYFHSLSPASLMLALEKPKAWEYKLFFQSWADAVDKRSNLLREYREKLKLELAEHVSTITAKDWLSTRFHELSGLVDSANILLEQSVQKALGPPGKPGDAEEIVWVAQMLGQLFETTLNWSKRIRCAHVEEPFDRLMPELALFADKMITQLKEFPKDCFKRIEDALASSNSEESQEVKLIMKIEMANLDAYSRTLEEILCSL